ncbi:DUF397 domain-containing protein [Spirillospora sp. NBC_00431]
MSVSDVTEPGWRRSTHCGANGTCVEVAMLSDAGLIGVRDAKRGDQSPVLTYDRADWRGLIHKIKEGSLDRAT